MCQTMLCSQIDDRCEPDHEEIEVELDLEDLRGLCYGALWCDVCCRQPSR